MNPPSGSMTGIQNALTTLNGLRDLEIPWWSLNMTSKSFAQPISWSIWVPVPVNTVDRSWLRARPMPWNRRKRSVPGGAVESRFLKRRKPPGWLNFCVHQLPASNRFPRACMTVVTGVSGSVSSLVMGELVPWLETHIQQKSQGPNGWSWSTKTPLVEHRSRHLL